MNTNMKRIGIILALVALAIAPAAMAGKTGSENVTVAYSGQGTIADGFGGYALEIELCGVPNGADREGPYLLWVLTATGATNATITGPWGTEPMVKFGSGTFKYISDWYPIRTLLIPAPVTAWCNFGRNPQLTISHGCRPFTTKGAWCSPGFWWKAADDDAWALTGHSKTDLFNATVYDYFYGATFGVNPTLYGVLNAGNPSPYKGDPGPDAIGTSGCAMNAFNATGAFLTDELPVYDFDCGLMLAGSEDACPIDSHGDWKK